MPLIEMKADLTAVLDELKKQNTFLELIARILSAQFPMAHREVHWSEPSNDMHIVDDQELLGAEDKERRDNQQPVHVSELGDESIDPHYDPYKDL